MVTNTGWYDVIVTNSAWRHDSSAPVLLTVVAPVDGARYVTNVWKLAAGGSNVSFLDTSSYYNCPRPGV